TGSYQVYENVNVDTTGAETPFPYSLDSVYVGNDSVFSGNTYKGIWEYRNGNAEFYLLRDSASSYISQFGNIIFSETNGTDTLSRWIQRGYFNGSYQMSLALQPISTPA